MDAVIRGTTMPVLEVHLTPGESVVAESGQLGWFDDGIELETSSALAGADGLWDAAKRSFGGGSVLHDAVRVDDAARHRRLPGAAAGQDLPDAARARPLVPDPAARLPRRPRGQRALDRVRRPPLRLGGCSAASASSSRSSRAPATRGSSSPARSERVRPRRRDSRCACTRRTSASSRRASTYELTTVPGIKNKIFGGDGLFLVRLTGPGKVWLQSLSLPMLAHALQPYLVAAGRRRQPRRRASRRQRSAAASPRLRRASPSSSESRR